MPYVHFVILKMRFVIFNWDDKPQIKKKKKKNFSLSLGVFLSRFRNSFGAIACTNPSTILNMNMSLFEEWQISRYDSSMTEACQ